jgi:hypothetical protein
LPARVDPLLVVPFPEADEFSQFLGVLCAEIFLFRRKRNAMLMVRGEVTARRM